MPRRGRRCRGKSDHLFIFPSNYEGLDLSQNVICTGPLPNQQVIPAVNWCFETLKARKFYLIGSSDVMSYAFHTIVRDQLKALGVVGRREFRGDRRRRGDGGGRRNQGFGGGRGVQLGGGRRQQGVLPSDDARGVDPREAAGAERDHHRGRPPRPARSTRWSAITRAWGYFQSVDRPENRAFIDRFQKMFGEDRPTSDSIVVGLQQRQALAAGGRGGGDGRDGRGPQAPAAADPRRARGDRLDRLRHPAHLAAVLFGQGPSRRPVRHRLESGQADPPGAVPDVPDQGVLGGGRREVEQDRPRSWRRAPRAAPLAPSAEDLAGPAGLGPSKRRLGRRPGPLGRPPLFLVPASIEHDPRPARPSP